ncbi:MAG TPA: beta-propeller fold lactonase family protein [Acidobacteriaceae bacterium]|jgi:6-phosphogluconolactonase (cycloisomerase 2 family)|nr:beta-propeller fold lactonase family protein [Acidobacteriaceae bacterium]
MKWSQYGRITLALVASLALGLSITACNPSFTLGYVYVLTAQSNLINAYTIDSASGALTQVANSPFPSGGQYPIASAIDHENKWLYVVHEIDNTVVQFAIGVDGKLYAQHTYNTPGTYPISVSIDPKAKFLYVVDSYAPVFNNSGATPLNINQIANNPATYGCVVVFPISSTDGSLGKPVTDPVTSGKCFPLNASTAVLNSQPIGITATASGSALYVANQGTGAGGNGSVYAYRVNEANGVLTALTNNNFPAGVVPSAITSDPSSRFVYVTDQSSDELFGYTIQKDESLQSMGNPYATGGLPNAVIVDPRGQFLYLTDFNTNTILAYTINQTTGVPTALTSGHSYGTGTGPTCLVIEPAYGRFLYTSNFLDNTASGFELNSSTGALIQVLNTPFRANPQPTCVAAAANATHPVSLVTP